MEREEIVQKTEHIIFSDYCEYDLDKADELYERIKECSIKNAIEYNPLAIIEILLEIIDAKETNLEEAEKENTRCRALLKFMSKKAAEVLDSMDKRTEELLRGDR